MLISNKYRFIFIHIYKNAGSSITHALMPFAANKLQRGGNLILKRFGISCLEPQPYLHHIKACELISKIGQKAFKSYFSFAIVRNPWDWQVSLYTFMLKDTSHYQHEIVKSFRNFDEYIIWRCAEEAGYQKDFIFSEQGEQLVDFIGRYENLAEDFEKICSNIGISATLPALNVSRTKPYQEYYNEKTVDIVRRTFAPDIHLFNYDF